MSLKRVAVIDRDVCNPKVCGNFLCQRICPVNRSDKDCITVHIDNKPLIDEDLCISCGICVKKCPKMAISVVNLPARLEENPIHRYGLNMFELFKMPVPKKNAVVGLISQNGLGKSTVMNILSGNLKPNIGKIGEEADWKDVIGMFRGTELQDFLQRLAEGKIKSSYKPQHVDMIPDYYKGKVKDILLKDNKTRTEGIIKRLGMENILDKSVSDLSGGELQLFAVIGAMAKEADFYFFDEPSSYLDVYERFRVARAIRELAEKAIVMVVEHDLAVADYLADHVHILYGKKGVFGIVSNPYVVRNGINIFLDGNIKEENMRFREESITFSIKAKENVKKRPFIKFPSFSKKFDKFNVETEDGEVNESEVIGILGPNATGKTTFIRMLVGELKPDKGESFKKLKLAYKPQRLVLDEELRELVVSHFIKRKSGKKSFGKDEKRILNVLGLERLLERKVSNLSGGELQSVMIASVIIAEKDIMLLDEPSAFLDVEQRLRVAKLIRSHVEEKGIPCFVVDHDLQFLDSTADRVMIFEGEPGKNGKGKKLCGLEEGINIFLKSVGITYRRDPSTGRPRANKPGSQKDEEQKRKGKYFYG